MVTTSRVFWFSRAARLLLTVGTLALIASWSTTAHAKKKSLKMDPSVAATPEPTGPVPPEADASGHVNYGNPQADGLGRVTVTATKGEKVQVFLEGRYFGDAPVTIYSVPKGDYIVEGTVVSSGKQLSRPVSVSENEEAAVELGGEKIETPPDATASGGFMSGDITPQRKRTAEIFAVAAGVTLIAGITFAILEHGAEGDYESAPAGNQQNLDSISSRGRRDALLANVGFSLAGVCVVGAIVAGYPMFAKKNAEKAPDAPTTALLVAPMLAPGTAGGALSFRF
jgi:hypothetical protein